MAEVNAAQVLSICAIPGDGIGPEVIGSAKRILDAYTASSGRLDVTWNFQPGGYEHHLATGDSMPESTLLAALQCDATLVGAFAVASMPVGTKNPLRALRRRLGVRASVRPAKAFGVLPAIAGVDLVVVREVTEGLYSGIEYAPTPDSACAVRVITREKSRAAARVAFDLARGRRRKVTAVHKRAALPVSDGLFLDSVAELARDFPDVTLDRRSVDALAMDMVMEPSDIDVVLSTNSFGDILSDLAAGLTGGVGVAPSGCVGVEGAYFEPIHGTAPRKAGKGLANPTGAVRSLCMLLEHAGQPYVARTIESALLAVVERGQHVTTEQGGSTSTEQFTDAVVRELDDHMDAG